MLFLKDDAHFEVSDLYRWEPSFNEIVQRNPAQYKTFYWVAVTACILPDVTDDCT
jgi:hypothetical protein